MAEAYFVANGIALPRTARGYPKYSLNDVQEKAYTDALGNLHKKTIAWKKKKFEFKWTSLTNEELQTIIRATKSGTDEWFTFDYYDPETGRQGHLEKAYSGDTLSFDFDKGATNRKIWKDVSVSIIQR